MSPQEQLALLQLISRQQATVNYLESQIIELQNKLAEKDEDTSYPETKV